jgi:hypothetical protein
MSGAEISAEKYWRSLKITGKIIEGKSITVAKSHEHKNLSPNSDLYCTGNVDNRVESEIITPPVEGSRTPFWVFNGLN